MSGMKLRAVLLASTTVVSAVAVNATPAAAATTIYGGGASLPAIDYAGPRVAGPPPAPTPTSPSEEYSFAHVTNTNYLFQYYYASSGKGQTSFSNNNPTIAGGYNGVAGHTVQYAASDAFLAAPGGASGTSNGFTYTVGATTTVTYPNASLDGALIQIPMLGTGVAFPARATNGTTSAQVFTKDTSTVFGTAGQLFLTDDAVCNIFSGNLKTWAAVGALPGVQVNGASGTITVNYRSDSSGTTFLFTNHLKAVCNASNSTSDFTTKLASAAPTTTFANLFTAIPSNFNPGGSAGSAAVATALAGQTSGIAYISPDFTHITTAGQGNPGGVQTSTLFDAAVKGAGETSYFLPTSSFVQTALTNAQTNPTPAGVVGTNLQPPTSTSGNGGITNPLNWVPSIQKVASGYPVVGYTNWILARCYSTPSVAAGIVQFLTNHFNGTYNSVTTANGFVPTPGALYNTAIKNAFLTGSSSLGINTAGAAGTDCASVTGQR